MNARELIDEIAASGRHHFTPEEVAAATNRNLSAARAQLRRLKDGGFIAEPVRGFLVIIPPEYRKLGCLPAEQFLPELMALAGEPYYFGLLTAAQYHGAAHMRPQATQVMVRENRQAIACGEVRIEFVARGDLIKMPTTQANTPWGVARYSTREVTALELVGYPKRSGGLSNVATVLQELCEEMEPAKLVDAAKLSPLSWAQRLGYLLELIGRKSLAAALEPFVAENAQSYTPLRRAAGTAGPRVATWKVIANVEVVPDL